MLKDGCCVVGGAVLKDVLGCGWGSVEECVVGVAVLKDVLC